jgi:hypothetical protein
MRKKGQITLFIIIGIVLLIVVGVTLVLIRNVNKAETDARVGESISLQAFVEECIEEIAIPAIYLQGLQGGYIFPIDDSFVREGSDYSISYLYDRESNVPTRKQIQSELNLYVNANLRYCLGGFESYKNMGYKVETGLINTDSIISIDDIQIKVSYPITLKQGDKQEKIDEFSVTIPVRLGYLNDLSREIIDAVVKDPSKIDMTMLGEFDVDVSIIPYSEDTIIYSFYDEKSNIRDKRYIFLFATKV